MNSAIGFNSMGPQMMREVGGCSDCGATTGGAKKKRKLTAYNKFIKANFKIVQKQYPNEKAKQILARVAKQWKSRAK